MIIFSKDEVYVTKHKIAQSPTETKEELFVTSDGRDFGVFSVLDMKEAISTAIFVASIPKSERHNYTR